ncbi:MAG: orotidine-5'-phosphate decarboxylase [Anaerolineae bacterium]|nr:orotidine-5'-phosphate decarboxylase [Anaerolineae bacterium]
MTLAIEKYDSRAAAVDSLLCIGLDSTFNKLPAMFRNERYPQFAFNRWIIEQTHDYVSAYKPNMAFYEERGADGLVELGMTIEYLRAYHPAIFTICDAKRADIESSNQGYVDSIFDRFGFDAVTLHPYLGGSALQPFLSRGDKACILLCRTSNPGAGELQDLDVGGRPLWQVVAEKARHDWNANGNVMLVVGATYPQELQQVRAIVGEMTLLVPGIGAQGGSVEQVIAAGLNRDRRGLIVNAGRSIIFADDPAAQAQRLRDQMRQRVQAQA